MQIITLTHENLQAEHICCAIASNNDCQVAAKKAWLSEMLDNGLVFKKLNARGKCFIEYVPAENAWAPVDAPDFMYINCLWVSGQFKGHGYAAELLGECVADSKAKNKRGIAVLSSQKKLPFLSDPSFLRHEGFLPADSAAPTYELYYLPLVPDCPPPRFKPHIARPHSAAQPLPSDHSSHASQPLPSDHSSHASQPLPSDHSSCAAQSLPSDHSSCASQPASSGFTLYYTAQCPYTAKYVPIAAELARSHAVPFAAIQFTTAAQAQASPCPVTTYALFRDGAFVTHEILSPAKLEKLFSAYHPAP